MKYVRSGLVRMEVPTNREETRGHKIRIGTRIQKPKNYMTKICSRGKMKKNSRKENRNGK